MIHLRVVVLFIVVVVLGLAACGNESTIAGDRLPVQQPGEDYGHQSVPLTGLILLQDDGCWTVDLGDGDRLVVFPQGFTQDPNDGSLIVGPDGTIVQSATVIDAMGGVVPSSQLADGSDGYWGGYLAFCNPEVQDFVVLDALE